LTRDLAEIINNDPLSIRLTFTPKGYGNSGDEFFLSTKENKCCCCGSEKELSKHHIFPKRYKRFLSLDIKSRDHHDVIALCVDCHSRYENESIKLREELSKKYDAPVYSKIINKTLKRINNFASRLIVDGENLHKEAYKKMMKFICGYENKKVEEITKEYLENLVKNTNQTVIFHEEVIMSKIENLQEFVELWRKHFIETMRPKFMPEHWNINRAVVKNK
jgi:hypothetical protein